MQQDMEINSPEDAGRSTDSVLGHLSLGEVVIPRAFLDDPDVLQMLQEIFKQSGEDIAEFTVGDPANKINPETGYPEFFKWGKLLKIAAPIALSLLAPGVGTALGTSLGLTAGAGAATVGNGLIGAGIGALGGGGLKGAAIGGITGGLGANIGNVGTAADGGSGILGAAGRNIPGVYEIADGLSGIGDSISNSLGLSGDASSGATGYTPSGGLKDYAPKVSGDAITQDFAKGLGTSPSPLTGSGLSSSGGGSSFGGSNTLASALGGVNQSAALKKQKQQLLTGNQEQLANLETFDPSNITNDAGYQFKLEQGQKGLNASLGAQGNLFSGRALKEASEYNQNYANNALKDAYSRWLTKTGAQNALIGNSAGVEANTTGNQASNLSQTLSNALGANVGNYSQDDLLKKLLLARA